MNNIWVQLLVQIVFLTVQHWIIMSAVLAHTLNSVTAVTILENETRLFR